jgi:hypothetical protein
MLGDLRRTISIGDQQCSIEWTFEVLGSLSTQLRSVPEIPDRQIAVAAQESTDAVSPVAVIDAEMESGSFPEVRATAYGATSTLFTQHLCEQVSAYSVAFDDGVDASAGFAFVTKAALVVAVPELLRQRQDLLAGQTLSLGGEGAVGPDVAVATWAGPFHPHTGFAFGADAELAPSLLVKVRKRLIRLAGLAAFAGDTIVHVDSTQSATPGTVAAVAGAYLFRIDYPRQRR